MHPPSDIEGSTQQMGARTLQPKTLGLNSQPLPEEGCVIYKARQDSRVESKAPEQMQKGNAQTQRPRQHPVNPSVPNSGAGLSLRGRFASVSPCTHVAPRGKLTPFAVLGALLVLALYPNDQL